MKIKKLITSGFAAAAGVTMLFGAALGAVTLSDGLGTFFEKTDSTYKSPLIVVGDTAGVQDVIGATDIAASFVSNFAVEEKTVPAGGVTTSVTDGVLIKSEKDYTWLNTSATFTAIKTTVTSSDLPTLLAKGSVDTTSGTPVTFEQLINLGAHYVGYNENPEDIEEPTLNVEFGTGTTYDLKVNFFGGLDTDYIDTTTEIKFFGKLYTFGPNPSNTSLTLYSQTGAETVTIGNAAGLASSATVEADGVDYTVSFLGWDPQATNTATVKIEYGGNSVTKSWTESNTYTLPGSTTQVFVNRVDVVATGAEAQSASIELFIGTDKLELNDGQNVKKNTETMDYTTVAFSSTDTKINTLTFTIAPDDDEYLVDGGEFVDPLFGSFKFALNGLTPGFTDDSRDVVKIAKSGSEEVKVTFTNDDGTEYNMDVLYYESGWKLGDGTRTLFVEEANTTTGTGWITKNSYFVIESGKKSYIMKYTGYDDDDNVLSFKDMGNSEDYEMTHTGSGNATGNLIIGAAQFDVTYDTGSHKIAVDLDDDDSIDEGDMSHLLTSNDGIIDLGTEVGNVTFTEYKLYPMGDYEPTETSLKVVTTYDGAATEISTVRVSPSPSLGGQVESEKLYHYLSYFGTYIVEDTDADTVTLYYPGNRPAYANVAIGSDPVISTTAGAAGGTYNAAIPVTNPVAKFASEVSKDTTLDKNIILVGGPCANAIVKTLLNDAWNTTDSCDYWLNTHDTLKTSGNGMVKVVEDVFGSGKKALIVAGRTAADTRNLVANKVIKPTVYAGLSGSEYIGAV